MASPAAAGNRSPWQPPENWDADWFKSASCPRLSSPWTVPDLRTQQLQVGQINRNFLFRRQNGRQGIVVSGTPSTPGACLSTMVDRYQTRINPAQGQGQFFSWEDDMQQRLGFFFNTAYFPARQTAAGSNAGTSLSRMVSYAVHYSSYETVAAAEDYVMEGSTAAPVAVFTPEWYALELIDTKQPIDYSTQGQQRRVVNVDVSFIKSSESALKSVFAMVNSMGCKPGSYITIIPCLDDGELTNDQYGVNARPNIYKIQGASLGHATGAAIAGCPPVHSTGWLAYVGPALKLDSGSTYRTEVYGDAFPTAFSNEYQSKGSVPGTVNTFFQVNFIETVEDLMLKIAYCVCNNTSIIVPNLTHTGQSMATYIRKAIDTPNLYWLKLQTIIYNDANAQDGTPYLIPSNNNNYVQAAVFMSTTMLQTLLYTSFVAYAASNAAQRNVQARRDGQIQNADQFLQAIDFDAYKKMKYQDPAKLRADLEEALMNLKQGDITHEEYKEDVKRIKDSSDIGVRKARKKSLAEEARKKHDALISRNKAKAEQLKQMRAQKQADLEGIRKLRPGQLIQRRAKIKQQTEAIRQAEAKPKSAGRKFIDAINPTGQLLPRKAGKEDKLQWPRRADRSATDVAQVPTRQTSPAAQRGGQQLSGTRRTAEQMEDAADQTGPERPEPGTASAGKYGRSTMARTKAGGTKSATNAGVFGDIGHAVDDIVGLF